MTTRRFARQIGLRGARRILLSLLVLLGLASTLTPALAERGDRSLYLYYTHTRETTKITFKHNGRYVQQGLKDLNWFLRDWRRKESTKMDPRLFDLLWEVYQDVGASKPIHVVSAYRSPKTNEMLRSRSKAVAKNSRHTQGMAMDFFIPGVKLSKLRATAMKKQFGGVGYYPASGSPFVHLDTGSVRAWPRMTHTQLAKIFPSGKTLHLPSNGDTLSAKGRKYAAVEWKKCHRVPCGAGTTTNNTVRATSGGGKTLLALFGLDKKSDAPTTRTITTAKITSDSTSKAPKPVLRPLTLSTVAVASLNSTLLTSSPIISPVEAIEANGEAEQLPGVPLAPKPPLKPEAILIATRARNPVAEPSQLPIAVASLDSLGGIAPRLRPARLSGNVNIDAATLLVADAKSVLGTGTPDQPASNTLMAFAPPTGTSSNFFNAIDEILAQAVPGSQVAASSTFLPRARPTQNVLNQPDAIQFAANQTRQGTLIAPDLAHVVETMADGYAFASARYAILWHPDIADINAATHLGAGFRAVKFSNAPGTLFQSDHFQSRSFKVASR